MIQTVKFVIGNLHTYNLYKYIILGPGHVHCMIPQAEVKRWWLLENLA